MIYACFNSEMSLSCVIWVCLMLDCWLTQCCVDYRTRICQRRYLALLAEIRRQRQAQREREEHEEEERRRQQLEDERKRRLEQENLRKNCPLCSHRSVLMAVACVKVVCVCVFTGPASPPVPLPRKKKPEPRPRSERNIVPKAPHLAPVPRPRSKLFEVWHQWLIQILHLGLWDYLLNLAV